MTRRRWRFVLIFIGFVCGSTGYADDRTAAKGGTEKTDGPIVAPATVKVEKGRLAASVTLKGTFEGDATTEVAVRLKSWSGPLTVEKAVEPGTQVKTGNVLLTFDAEK